MATAEFSLKERDKKRYIKDRLARFTVTSGGVGVLAAILLIFFYLLTIVLPIFSSANVESLAHYAYSHKNKVVGVGVGEYGENAYLFDNQGQLSYVGLIQGEAQTLLTTQVMSQPSVFTMGDAAQGWYAYGNRKGEVVAVKPQFSVSFTGSGRVLTPNMQAFYDGNPILLDPLKEEISQLAFSIQNNVAVFVGITNSGQARAMKVEQLSTHDVTNSDWRSSPLSLPNFPKQIDEITLSPNARQLFILSGDDLIIAHRREDTFRVREVVDLSRNSPEKEVVGIELLSGAQSVLVTHKNNTVSQWFDVLKNGERHLTRIRGFDLESLPTLLIPDTYRKGFYTLHGNGKLNSIYTTSERLLFSETLFSEVPQNAALSNNEKFLIAVQNSQLQTYKIENAHPEISFSSLWNKVWYESYPEPQFVWQSTSASDDFEAKFSLIPIAFGTLKATFFAMLFSVPIAILGAIYTAYFMSSSMRKVVKPTVELMEALPTVIIGFIAGLWLAPIIESNLSGVVALMFVLPLSSLLMGILWSAIPSRLMSALPNGWHAIILIPVFLVLTYVSLASSAGIEKWLFNGDVRIFLDDYGLNYDQRNALVVGLAMGFAVIPTIFTIAEDAIFSVPQHLSDGSLALGATQWQTLIYVVLLTASPGIFSAVMIGLGRAVGETMIVLMATGNTPIMDMNIFEGMRSLSATIAVEMPESEVGDSHYRLLFLSALILFLFTFVVNSLAEIVRQRLKDKYSSM